MLNQNTALSRLKQEVCSAIALKLLKTEAEADEMELWPELIWSAAALVASGCSTHKVFQHLHEALTAKLAKEQETQRKLISGSALAVALAREDQEQLLAACTRRSAAGYPLAEIEHNLSLKRSHSLLRAQQLLACWHISTSTGAPLHKLLENLASHCENDIDAYEARSSALAGPAATGALLSWLPLAGLGLGILMGTNPLGFLFASLPGAILGGLGLGLALYGRRWTRRLITRAEELEL